MWRCFGRNCKAKKEEAGVTEEAGHEDTSVLLEVSVISWGSRLDPAALPPSAFPVLTLPQAPPQHPHAVLAFYQSHDTEHRDAAVMKGVTVQASAGVPGGRASHAALLRHLAGHNRFFRAALAAQRDEVSPLSVWNFFVLWPHLCGVCLVFFVEGGHI